MRYSWQQIQEIYPDQWVLLKDMADIRGNLISAVVLHACKERLDINRFEAENPDKIPYLAAVRYTGNPIEGFEGSDDDMFIEMELSDVI